MTSGQETEWVYSYNPVAHMGHLGKPVPGCQTILDFVAARDEMNEGGSGDNRNF